MQNRHSIKATTIILACLSFILEACSSQLTQPSPSIGAPTSSLLNTPTTETLSIDTATPHQEIATNTPQVKYLNSYASVASGKYLACQIYDQNSAFVFELSLIDSVNGATTSLLKGIPVGAITPDGKYVISGGGPNDLFYVWDLELDRYQASGKPANYIFSEYDYPVMSPNGMDIAFVHSSRGILIWSISKMRPIIQADIIQNPNDLILQNIYWSANGDNFAFYTRYTKGPKPIEGLYVIDKSCLATSETCVSDSNKLISEPYGSAPLAWTPDGKLAVVDWGVDNGASINIYDISSGRKTIKTIHLNSDDGRIDELFWSPNNDAMAVQQSNVDYVTILSKDGEILGRIDGCSGQLLGWVIIGT